MADLLQQVFSEIQKLPADQRDAIAARILTDLKDEQAWTERFEATTDEQWIVWLNPQEGKLLRALRYPTSCRWKNRTSSPLSCDLKFPLVYLVEQGFDPFDES